MAKSFDNRDGWIWYNGSFIPWKKATIHIITQGLHYASTVFEGERSYNGKIFKSFSCIYCKLYFNNNSSFKSNS